MTPNDRSMKQSETAKVLTCECGNDTYHIKFDFRGGTWATCEACGRPSSTVGSGWEKQMRWYHNQETDR